MFKDITLGQYFPGNSPVHRLDPRTKLLLMIAYLVAVFLSGERELADATSDLLCYNRKRLAEKEVQRQRQQGMVLGM